MPPSPMPVMASGAYQALLAPNGPKGRDGARPSKGLGVPRKIKILHRPVANAQASNLRPHLEPRISGPAQAQYSRMLLSAPATRTR